MNAHLEKQASSLSADEKLAERLPQTVRDLGPCVPPEELRADDRKPHNPVGREVANFATVDTAPAGYLTVYPSAGGAKSPVDTVAFPSRSAGNNSMIPGYEIQRELGRGGMGVVYLARQLRPERLVALKMVLAGAHAGEEELIRFRREIEAVASVSHPNLVPVYEVGEHEGRPYYAMQFVAGGSLAAWIGARPQPAQAAAFMAEALARAMQAVHQRGIVHRDLKPANILLEEVANSEAANRERNTHQMSCAQGRSIPGSRLPIPKIADFGLAKTLDEAGSPTLSGAVLGTPSYMAPEQADGKIREIGPRTDVYALGAILYHMLTGRPPFQAETPWDTVSQVKSDEPVAPRRLQPRVPVDLETICLKCLRKEPARRYGSAEELADELRRFLAGEPVQARPIGLWERAVKWARRRPATAALVAVCCLAVAALGTGLLIHTTELRAALAQSEANAEEGRRRLVRLHVAQGTRFQETGDELSALPWFAAALNLSEGRPDEEEAHRIRIAVTLRHCPRLVHFWSHGAPMRFAAFDADGRHVLTATEDGTAQVFDTVTGKTVGPALVHGNPTPVAVISPDGRRVVTAGADGTTRYWNVTTGQCLIFLSGHRAKWTCASFRPDSRTLVAADTDRMVWTLNAETGEPLGSPWQHGPGERVLAFNREGTRAVTVADVRSVRVWDIATGQPISPPLPHSGPVLGASFAPDGGRIVTAGADGSARLWSIPDGQLLGSPLRQRGSIRAAAFSADGRSVVTAGDDNTARVWHTDTGDLVSPPLRHNGSVQGAAFHANGRLVLTVANDRTVRLWTVFGRWQPKWIPGPTPAPPNEPGPLRWLSADGRRVVILEGDCGARLCDVTTGETLGSPLNHGSAVLYAAFSPDGTRVVTVSDDNTARIWNGETGALLAPPLEHAASVRFAAFSPDGRWLATTADDGTGRAWDPRTGEPLTRPLSHPAGVQSAHFTADSRCLRLTAADGSIQDCDLEPDARPAADLLELAHLLAGSRVDGVRGLLPLGRQEMQSLWQRLRAVYPTEFEPISLSASVSP